MTIAVLDAAIFINKEYITANKHITTQAVFDEIKDRESLDFLQSHFMDLTIRNPSEKYISKVQAKCTEMNSNMSLNDIGLVALTLELSEELSMEWITLDNYKMTIRCHTHDNGVKSLLKAFYLGEYSLNERIYKYRCFTCFKIYEEPKDFCRSCGYKTITRVAIRKEGDKEIVCLKKDYVQKEKSIKDKNGKEIICEDTTEYQKYKKYMRRKQREEGFTPF